MSTLINAAQIAEHAAGIHAAPDAARPVMAASVRKQIAALVAQLDKQFDWLGKNQSHTQWTEFFDRWEADLRHYEAACDALAVVPEETQGRLIA